MSAKGTYWFWSDWLGDQAVRRLTPAERGVWIDLIALAAVGNPVGYVCDEVGKALPLDEIARVTNAGTVEQVSELINGILKKGAASRDRTGRLFNRRMVRKAELSAKRAWSGKLGGESTTLRWKHFNAVPGQMPRQLPQGLPRSKSPSLTLQESKTTTEYEEGKRSAEEAIERIRANKLRRI